MLKILTFLLLGMMARGKYHMKSMVTDDDNRIMAPTPSPLGADPSPASPLSPMTTSMDVLMEG